MAKRKLSFIVTNSGNINVVANNKAYSIPFDHPNYQKIKTAIVNDNVDEFILQSDVKKAVADYTKAATEETVGVVEVRDGVVYWKQQPVHNAVSSRILQLMRDGFPFDSMLKFLENLLKNPSYRAVNELYEFLSHQGLPITEDGCFLGYKRVREDYTDVHTGTCSNKIGCVLEMPRNTVDDNWRQLCSSGFHVGSIEYVREFANDPNNHVMLVKVNPADVVSVPTHENTKLRTCKYEVVAEYDKQLLQPMPETLHTAAGVPVQQKPVDQKDWDDLDEEEDDSESEDDDYEFDSDLDDDDDEFGEITDIIKREQDIKDLVAKANAKNVNPFKLAYRLDYEYTGEDPTIEEIIRESIVRGERVEYIEKHFE